MRYQNYNNSGNYFWIGILVFFAFGGFRTIFLLLGLVVSLFPLLTILGVVYFLYRRIVRNTKVGGSVHSFGLNHNQFIELFVRICIQAMRADGQVSQIEIDSLKSFFRQQFRYQGYQVEWLNDLIESSLSQTYSLRDLCDEFKQRFPGEPCYVVLDMIYRIISVDQLITDSELDIANQVAQFLEIPESIHSQIRSPYVQFHSDTDKYYAVLGIKKGVTADELKKAYRQATKTHHPDRVQHLGEDLRLIAEEKIKQINEAYSILSKQLA